MKKFEVGSAIWAVLPPCRVVFANVTNPTISRYGTIEAAKLGEVQSYGYLPEDCFPTELEAHNEAVRRAHSIVNRAELARARAMPEDQEAFYCVFGGSVGTPILCLGGMWRKCEGEVFIGVFQTPEAAILAVIPEDDRG